MSSLLAQTKAILRQHGLRPNKRLGQSFLVDANILDKILAAAQITPQDTVLEIGPGTGVLTESLLALAGQVIAVEYDKGLYEYLKSKYKDCQNMLLIHGDYLKVDLEKLLSDSFHTPHPRPLSQRERGVLKEPRGELPDYLLELCRKFRQESTETEKIIWDCLRHRQLYGLKFRRQYAIGRYIADFYCHEHKLVVEVDGGVHLKKEQQLYDEARQEDLEGQGFLVLRITTEEIKEDLERVLIKIAEDCFSHYSPLPPGEGLGVRGKGREVKDKLKVVANLPYYISTPLLFKLIEERRFFDYAILMLQKEVVARLMASPGTKDYGALTLAIALHAQVERIAPVSRHCFYPAPEVDSALIKLTCREHPAVELQDEALFQQVVRAAFAQRRKTLANALKAVGAILASRGKTLHELPLQEALKKTGIDGKRRGETLSLEEFARLSNALYQVGATGRSPLHLDG